MTEAIIVALIGAAGIVIVAIINKIGDKKKASDTKTDGQKTVINQKAKGNNATQIGIQINKNVGENSDRQHD